MLPVPINDAEGVVETFWDPGLSDLGDWAFEPGPGTAAKVKQQWWCAEPSWQNATPGQPVFSMRREIDLPLAGYDALRTRCGLPSPFFATGENLIVNARCGEKGHLQVEITDPLETPWEGSAREDCDRFVGDDVNHVVSWKRRRAVNEILGYTGLRFYMKDAQLFSFRMGAC